MKFTVALLIACALLFAFFGSDTAYRSDEVWSLNAVSQPPAAIIETLKKDTHPPFYFLLLSAWCKAFGTSEPALRSLSSVFYLAGIAAMYAAALSLYNNSSVALFAAAIFAISPLNILAAQFGRMYALLALLSALSTWTFLELRRSHWNSRLWLSAWCVVNTLGTFTHVWFFFLIVAQYLLITALLAKSRQARPLRLLIPAIFLTLLPYATLWLPILLQSQMPLSANILSWVPRPGLGSIGETLLLYGGVSLFLAPLLLLIRGTRPDWLPAVLLGATLAIPFTMSFAKPVYYTRYTIIGVPLFALFVGTWSSSRIPKFAIEGLLVFSVAIFLAVGVKPNPCDSRTGAVFLAQTAKQGDLAVFTGLSRLPLDYYLRRLPNAPNLREVSFPSEIDRHNGYEGRLDTPESLRRLNQEADALIATILQQPGRRLFYFYGFHPQIDNILSEKLDKQLHPLQESRQVCPDANISYFNHILAYEAPPF